MGLCVGSGGVVLPPHRGSGCQLCWLSGHSGTWQTCQPAASSGGQWGAPMGDGAMCIPVRKDVTPDPCPSAALSLHSIYSMMTFTGRYLTHLLPMVSCMGSLDAAPQQEHRILGLSSQPDSPSPWQSRFLAVHPSAPRARSRQGGHSSSLGRCKRICPLCPDNIVFVAEREEPASTR